MHAKTDSEVTSLADSSPPRSPRGGGGRQIYYVMSPSHPDVEKVSLGGSSTGGSPIHHFHRQQQQQHHNHHHYYYASSPINYSRESTATRLSASLKLQPSSSAWQKLHRQHHTPSHHSASGAASDLSDDDDDGGDGGRVPFRCYVAWFILGFFALFTLFSLIIWGASKPYKPEIAIKSVIFEAYGIHAGMDLTGVPTKMLSINSTVRIAFRNPATFFGVHVSATPLELYYADLLIATGRMEEFYQSRKSGRTVTAVVAGQQVPLYGGGSSLTSRTAESGGTPAVVPLDLIFVVRARAYVLGRLVKSKFYRHIHCSLVLRESRLGKPLDLRNACTYHD